MKTSLSEIEQIEEYLLSSMNEENKLVFEAKLILSDELRQKTLWQKKTYKIIKQYGRQQLREEIEAIHQMVFHSEEHRTFKERILKLFSKK